MATLNIPLNVKVRNRWLLHVVALALRFVPGRQRKVRTASFLLRRVEVRTVFGEGKNAIDSHFGHPDIRMVGEQGPELVMLKNGRVICRGSQP